LQRFPGYEEQLRHRLKQALGEPSEMDPTQPDRITARSSTVRIPVLPGYEILGELGRGGMGIVYKARQLDLNRIIALKLIRAGPGATRQEISRFRTEASAVARLDHPGVVRIHHLDEYQGQLYFCMEYLPGGNLAGKLRQQRSLGVEESARL